MTYIIVRARKHSGGRLIIPSKFKKQLDRKYQFYSISLNGMPLSRIRNDDRISIPKRAVTRFKLKPDTTFRLRISNMGRGIVQKRQYSRFSKRSGFTYPKIYRPKDIQNPDRLLSDIKAFVTRMYRKNRDITLKIDYYREFFVKLHYIAVTRTGVIERPVVSTEVRSVYLQSSLRNTLTEVEALFLRMALVLNESENYETWYFQAVTYEIRDLITSNPKLNRGI